MSLFYSAGLGNAIPDTSMFQEPQLQWWGGTLGVSDGQQISSWTDGLSDVSASAVGDPVYRSDKSGFETPELDGSDDGFDFSSSAVSGTQISIAGLVYLEAGEAAVVSWGSTRLALRSGVSITIDVPGENDPSQYGSTSTGKMISYGVSVSSSDVTFYLNGSSVGTDGTISAFDTFDTVDQALGYNRSGNGNYTDGFMPEVIVSGAAESDQAFSDYHTNRLG